MIGKACQLSAAGNPAEARPRADLSNCMESTQSAPKTLQPGRGVDVPRTNPDSASWGAVQVIDIYCRIGCEDQT